MKNVLSATTMAALLMWSGVCLAPSIPAAESTGLLLNKVDRVERQVNVLFQHKIDSQSEPVVSQGMIETGAPRTPEPATMLLLGSGIVALSATFRSRKREYYG